MPTYRLSAEVAMGGGRGEGAAALAGAAADFPPGPERPVGGLFGRDLGLGDALRFFFFFFFVLGTYEGVLLSVAC